MVEKNIIEPSNSLWVLPVVQVRKNYGNIQYSRKHLKLSAVTWKDSYLLLKTDNSLDSLDKVQYFSTLYLGSRYWLHAHPKTFAL